jgi:hypothetical protein
VSTDKTAFSQLLLMSGLSPGYFSAFDEPTLDGIIENFIASTDWRPVEEIIRVDLSPTFAVDVNFALNSGGPQR